MEERFSLNSIKDLAARWFPRLPPIGTIHYDTTDFFRIGYGDALVLGKKAYYVRHNAKEGRFGLDDEEKFWVKRSIDLDDGSLKIVKLEFREKFQAHIGDFSFDCFRSPKKEARLLNLVSGHANFMHGYSVKDPAGNTVRVIDYIYGKTLHSHILSLQVGHEDFYHTLFPDIFKNFLECVEAVAFLHEHHEKHGDIRRDHIIIDRESGRYRWIDFDFNYLHRENIYSYDLFGLGNIFMYIVGMGDVLLNDLRKKNPSALDSLREDDLNIVFNNRVANLEKIFPYVSPSINRILMHFSKGAEVFYDNTSQMVNDLNEAYHGL